MSAPCSRTVLARGPIGSVERCTCGSIHLCVGPLSLRLETAAFLSLCDVVDVARDRLASPAAPRAGGAASPWMPPQGDLS